MVGVALAVVGVLAGVAAVYFAVAPQRSVKRLGSVDRFGVARRHLKRQVGSLFEESLAEQERFRHDRELPVLAREHWIPSRPLPLGSVLLVLRDTSAAEDLAEARKRVRRYLPRRVGGGRVDSYSEAVGLFDRPQIWFDSCSYRLLGVRPAEPGGEGLQLTFGLARYFDGQDTSEFLAYEAADRAARAKRGLTRGAYRTWLGDPFDFGQRCALPGISVLTVR